LPFGNFAKHLDHESPSSTGYIATYEEVVLLQGWYISLLGDAVLGFDAVEVDHHLLGMLRIQKNLLCRIKEINNFFASRYLCN